MMTMTMSTERSCEFLPLLLPRRHHHHVIGHVHHSFPVSLFPTPSALLVPMFFVFFFLGEFKGEHEEQVLKTNRKNIGGTTRNRNDKEMMPRRTLRRCDAR